MSAALVSAARRRSDAPAVLGVAVAAAPREGAESVNVTVLVQAAPYEWFYVVGIGLIAALTFVLGTFYKDRF